LDASTAISGVAPARKSEGHVEARSESGASTGVAKIFRKFPGSPDEMMTIEEEDDR
jgi:hypothetical protein